VLFNDILVMWKTELKVCMGGLQGIFCSRECTHFAGEVSSAWMIHYVDAY